MLGLLERKAIMVIFANVEDILLTNTTFMSSLEERQRSCRLYIENIGDILDKHLTNMTCYRVTSFCYFHSPMHIFDHASRPIASIRRTRSECCNRYEKAMQISPPICKCVCLMKFVLAEAGWG